MTQNQTLLLDHSQVQFEKPTTVTSAAFWPDDNLQGLIHDCHKRKDKTRNAGAAVVTSAERTGNQVIHISIQKVELIALTQALSRGKGKSTIVHTERLYAFTSAQVHSMFYRERRLLITKERTLKTKRQSWPS